MSGRRFKRGSAPASPAPDAGGGADPSSETILVEAYEGLLSSLDENGAAREDWEPLVLDQDERQNICQLIVSVSAGWPDAEIFLRALFAHLEVPAATQRELFVLRGDGTEQSMSERGCDPQLFVDMLHDVRSPWAALWGLLLFSVCTGKYLASHRESLRRLAAALHIPWSRVEEVEDGLAVYLTRRIAAIEADKKALKATKSRKRILKVAGGTIAGGSAITIGGVMVSIPLLPIVAPVVAGAVITTAVICAYAGVTSVIGGLYCVGGLIVLGTVPAVASMFGVGGAGLAGYKMLRRTGGLTEFEFLRVGETRPLTKEDRKELARRERTEERQRRKGRARGVPLPPLALEHLLRSAQGKVAKYTELNALPAPAAGGKAAEGKAAEAAPAPAPVPAPVPAPAPIAQSFYVTELPPSEDELDDDALLAASDEPLALDEAELSPGEPADGRAAAAPAPAAPEKRRVREQALHVWIGVSGAIRWLEDIYAPWDGVLRANPCGEHFCVRWESKRLKQLGRLIDRLSASKFGRALQRHWVALSALPTATAILTLGSVVAFPVTAIAFVSLLNNQWHVIMDRAVKAGRLLARLLLERAQGHRPVTLIGYSVGARALFYCLEELARRGARDLVHDCVLLGAPIMADPPRWHAARQAVAGRLVNAYSHDDWVLAVLYRTAHVQRGIAGLEAIALESVENVDVSGVVVGHMQYRRKVAEILAMVGMGADAAGDVDALGGVLLRERDVFALGEGSDVSTEEDEGEAEEGEEEMVRAMEEEIAEMEREERAEGARPRVMAERVDQLLLMFPAATRELCVQAIQQSETLEGAIDFVMLRQGRAGELRPTDIGHVHALPDDVEERRAACPMGDRCESQDPEHWLGFRHTPATYADPNAVYAAAPAPPSLAHSRDLQYGDLDAYAAPPPASDARAAAPDAPRVSEVDLAKFDDLSRWLDGVDK